MKKRRGGWGEGKELSSAVRKTGYSCWSLVNGPR